MPTNRSSRYVSEIYAYRLVLQQLIRQQLVLRYRRTVFGYLWTLINPLLMMSVTAVVFSTLFRMDLKTYAVFLFSGMIPFSCFSSVVTQSGQSLTGNEGLLKKVYIPKMLFPLGTSVALLIDSVLTSAALLLIILAIGGQLTLALLFLPIAYLLLFLFSFGIALIMAIATVYFRDLQYVVGIVMQALLFLTPVFYKPESMEGKVRWLVSANPLTPFVDLFRSAIHLGVIPDGAVIGRAALLASTALIMGAWFFRSHERKVAFRL